MAEIGDCLRVAGGDGGGGGVVEGSTIGDGTGFGVAGGDGGWLGLEYGLALGLLKMETGVGGRRSGSWR